MAPRVGERTGESTASPLRRLAAILEVGPRVRAVEERMERLGDEGFVEALDGLARAAARGASSADEDAMLACALFLLRAGGAHLPRLTAAARRVERPVAAAILSGGVAHKALSRRGRLLDPGGPSRVRRHGHYFSPGADVMRPTMEALYAILYTADEARARALALEIPEEGSWQRAQLPREHLALQIRRLAARPEPSVLRALLGEREVGVRVVLAIAARRPTTPAIVGELVAHDRWIARADVRGALVANPFTPTPTALLLLPTCRARLRSVMKADVHPRLRALAGALSACA